MQYYQGDCAVLLKRLAMLPQRLYNAVRETAMLLGRLYNAAREIVQCSLGDSAMLPDRLE